MPTSAEAAGSGWAVDTSVAVAYLDAGHAAHDTCVAAVGDRRPALGGHAAFESYSVLTRLPGATHVPGPAAAAALESAFPEPCWLSPAEQSDLILRLATKGITGGAVYDALVGEAARRRRRTLLTRDRRAARSYDLLGVPHELID